MKILIASHGYPPNQSAGAEWQAYRTARWMAERGHSVQVLAVDDNALPEPAPPRLTDEIVDGVRVRRWSYRLDQSLGAGGEFENPQTQSLIEQLLGETASDLLHLYCGLRLTLSATAGAATHGVPVVFTPTDFWAVCPRILLRRRTGELCSVPDDPADCALCILNEQRRYRLPHMLTGGQWGEWLKRWRPPELGALTESMAARRWVMKAGLKQVKRAIVQSQFLADVLGRHVLDPHIIAVTRQGSALAGTPRPESYAPGKPLTFGYIGQIAEHKGLSLLVKAFRALPVSATVARLKIYGAPEKAWPPYWEQLRREVGDDTRIEVAGSFSNIDALAVYHGLDAVIVPSLWYENSPNVILESFACRVPVLASAIGGMAELVQHGQSGYLFDVNSVASLRAALQTVIDKPGLLREWRKNIPAVRSVEAEMLELEGIYDTVLRESRTV